MIEIYVGKILMYGDEKKAVANILYLNNNSLGQFFDSVIWYYYVDDLYIKAQAYIVCIHKYYMTLFMSVCVYLKYYTEGPI